jgi:hypothetical protein
MTDRDPNIVTSGLSRTITEDGVTIRLEIYRLEHDPKWALEVVNEAGTSIVWDELYDTDDDAYATFKRTVAEEGMEAFSEQSNVVQFPTTR